MTQRWVRVPGAGEFRGEGQWKRLEECGHPDPRAWWDYLVRTGYLPTAEQDQQPAE